MTRNKDLKRLVRARMRKTREAYTAARAQITKKSTASPKPVVRSTPAPPLLVDPTPKDFAKLAGMSDAALKEGTGCAWEKWVRSLDHHGAATMSHRDIAAMVHSKYKVGPWWAQTVTVGYERIKGLRARGQQRNGTYGATKSRTFNVPVSELFDAWSDAAVRRRWLTGATTRVRTSTSLKSLRLDWNDGATRGIIAVGFTSKGASKSSVAVEHAKLTDREAAARIKQYWTDRLAALHQMLAER